MEAQTQGPEVKEPFAALRRELAEKWHKQSGSYEGFDSWWNGPGGKEVRLLTRETLEAAPAEQRQVLPDDPRVWSTEQKLEYLKDGGSPDSYEELLNAAIRKGAVR